MSDDLGLIVAIVAHARDVPAAGRAELMALIDNTPAEAAGGLVLETCHRVEMYVPGPGLPPAVIEVLPPGATRLDGDEAIRHAIAVAVGLDSVVLGEDQILHQLRAATARARAGGRLDPRVERLMNVALRAGRTARSWRTGPTPTLADAALEAVRRRGVDLRDAEVLVVGSGEMGRLAVDRAEALGARVSVTSRTSLHALALATTTGTTAVPFDPGHGARGLAAVIVALSGPWTLAAATIDVLLGGSAVIVDLSMPQAVPERLAIGPADRFVSIDRLAVETTKSGPAKDHARMVALVERSLSDYRRWAEGRGRRSMAEALVRRADAERSAELARLWRSHPDLDPQARSAIEQMSRHLTSRLLREPLERLGDDADGRVARAAEELFAL